MKASKFTSLSIIISLLLFFTCLINQVYSQSFTCGVPSNQPINHPLENLNKSVNNNPKFVFTIVRATDGSGGANRSIIEDFLLPDVKDFFAQSHIGIELNYCIREVHDSDWLYDHDQHLLCDDDPSSNYYYNIYPSGSGTVGGAATIGGCCGWGNPSFGTTMHEIGHMFSLPHTFNNCNSLTDAEPVHHHINDPLNCSGKHCTETGDGFCDTPADANGLSSIDANGNIVYKLCPPAFKYEGPDPCALVPTGLLDRCNIEYNDPLNIIRTNFMSYSDNQSCSDFTADQIVDMKNEIANDGRLGVFTACNNDEIITSTNTNVIDGGSHVIFKQTINYNNTLKVFNAEVRFIDCTLLFPEGINMMEIRDSYIQMENTKLLRSDDIYVPGPCENLVNKGGILSFGHSQLFMLDNTHIETEGNPVRTDHGSSMTFGAYSSKLTSLDGGRVDIIGSFWCEQTEIAGSVIHKGTGNASFRMENSIVQNSGSFGGTGINVQVEGQSIVLDNLKVTGFENGNSVRLNGGSWNSLYNCDLEGNALIVAPGGRVNVVNNKILANSATIETYDALKVMGASSYTIKNNTVNASDHYSAITIETENGSFNKCINNKINSGFISGINSEGAQENSLFLCNDINGSEGADFIWDDVSLLQGYNFEPLIATGNLFSGDENKIGGISQQGTVYNYFNLPREVLLFGEYTNTSIVPNTDDFLMFPAPCGVIGNVDPNCPVGINCEQPCPAGIDCTVDCPYGMNCIDPCPLGIDCTEPCPIGINCWQDCPPGIDCSSSCPPGINCYEPCPPGINCTEPCPPGINCWEACPPGIDCFSPCPEEINCLEPCLSVNCNPIEPPVKPPVRPIKQEIDNVLLLLESQYSELNSEAINLSSKLFEYENENSQHLDNIISLSNLNKKFTVLKYINSDPKLLTPHRLKLIFKNSNIYTEREVVSLISINPFVLYDSEINNIVFRSKSFSQENMLVLSKKMDEIKRNEEIQILWNLKKVDSAKEKLSTYALKRLNYTCPDNVQEIKKWYERLDDFSSQILFLEYSFWNDSTSQFNNEYNKIKNQNLTTKDKRDLESYKLFTTQLQSAKNKNETLLQLNDDKLKVLNSIALSNNYFSSLKARTFLTGYYGYKFEKVDNKRLVDKLKFLSRSTIDIRNENNQNNLFPQLYPNPSNGNFLIRNESNDKYSIELYSTNGSFISSFKNLPNSNQEYTLNLTPGVYICMMTNNTSNQREISKLIITN